LIAEASVKNEAQSDTSSIVNPDDISFHELSEHKEEDSDEDLEECD